MEQLGLSKKDIEYAVIINAGDPANDAWDQADLDRWCQLHGASSGEIVGLTVAAMKDGTGHVLLDVVERDDDGNLVTEGDNIKTREVLTPLLEPLPDLVRRIASR